MVFKNLCIIVLRTKVSALEVSSIHVWVNPSNGHCYYFYPKHKKAKTQFKPCHVGIHLNAFAEHSQMSICVPGFHSFFRFFAPFCIGKISHQQHEGNWEGIHEWVKHRWT